MLSNMHGHLAGQYSNIIARLLVSTQGFFQWGRGGQGGSFPPPNFQTSPPQDFDINLINCQALALKQVQIIVLISAVSNF